MEGKPLFFSPVFLLIWLQRKEGKRKLNIFFFIFPHPVSFLCSLLVYCSATVVEEEENSVFVATKEEVMVVDFCFHHSNDIFCVCLFTEEETLEFPEMESQNDEKKRDFILDEPSPRCVLELPMLSPCSDSGCSSSANSTEKLAQGSEVNLPQWKNMIDTFKKKSVRRFSVIPLLQTYDIIAKRNLKRKLTKMQNSPNLMIDWGGMAIPKPSWRNFDYKELEAATDNFSSGKNYSIKTCSLLLFFFSPFTSYFMNFFF